MLVWDPAAPGKRAIELGRHDGWVVGSGVCLSDGRVVSGGEDGRVLVWDLRPSPVKPAPSLGGTTAGSQAVAVLSDGRVVSGG